ncbi:MAG: hypothetical protein WBW33_35310 [Bryobacteraceae bacterium]
MKKIMSLMLGMSLLLGATAFAFGKDDTTTKTKATKATKAKKTKATKATS